LYGSICLVFGMGITLDEQVGVLGCRQQDGFHIKCEISEERALYFFCAPAEDRSRTYCNPIEVAKLLRNHAPNHPKPV